MTNDRHDNASQARLLKQYRRNAWSILVVGVGVGFVVIATTLMGTPIPPTTLLVTMGTLALFIILQVVRNARLLKRLKRLQARETPH
ncbi:heme exporter protein CcmD [Salinicola halophilus]|uniref:heme exporter protein CcmD n=1 Tax=Salinicola halophilus TaxID=184065 RepID=UPI000DA1CF8E|nr:heme exporter protein CcmD [Salinicola halophilus]